MVHLEDQVCIVTGANSGIGKATVLGLAAAGATVAMVCRDRARGEAAQREIIAASGNTSVELFLADLSDLQQVRQLATAFRQRHGRLHLLVNNAGAIFAKRSVTADGIERTIALNHCGPFLLTHLLLDVLEASAPARVVTVSSVAHFGASIDIASFTGDWHGRYHASRAYGQSKLANILFTKELARRLAGSGVTATCCHPGLVATNFAHRGGPFAWNVAIRLFRSQLRSPAEGADTVLWLSTSSDTVEFTGGYFAEHAAGRCSTAAQDMALAGQLWSATERLVGLGAVEVGQD